MLQKKIFTLITVLIISSQTLFSMTATEIIKKSESVMQGNTSYMKLRMQIITPRWEREIKLESWAIGTKKSFIHILGPARDKGITFLKRDNEIWQYVPRIERIIKIPPSMMMQSWMGSDFTNDDLVRESSMVTDYTPNLIETTTNNYNLELIPLPDSPVTWTKVTLLIDKKTFIPIQQSYFDEIGELVRQFKLSDIRKIQDRWFPFRWEMHPKTKDKKGRQTNVIIEKAAFNKQIPPSTFSLKALKEKSH